MLNQANRFLDTGNLSSGREQFDCELPHSARTELVQPRRARILGKPPATTQQVEHPSRQVESVPEPQRARILGKPPKPPTKRALLDYACSWWHPAFGWLLGMIFTVALYSIVNWFGKGYSSQPVPAPPAVVHPTSAATPIPALVQQQAPAIARSPAVQTSVAAPRAQLVRLPAPRLNLVEIAPEHIDETHVITMPYGMEVRATLRGYLGTEVQLPRVGHIGDMYVVGTTPCIYIQVPGTAAPTWVDP
jgi:hypothetical protein